MQLITLIYILSQPFNLINILWLKFYINRHILCHLTGLVCRLNTQQLYSCSKDRSVKLWDLEQLGYVDTLFGHVDAVVDIDALSR